ncbi:MAG: hypothetical protein LBJ91_05450 [Clostridiales Family XIII bacterium]|nr:hypothetical protein [Clostridiales Family XIII bacterium]
MSNNNTLARQKAVMRPYAPMRVFAFATAVAVACSLIIGGAAYSGGAAHAADPDARAVKEEVVYAVLSAGGEPEAAYVVNSFKPYAPGTFTDYGDYSNATALSAPEPIGLNGDAVTFALGDSPFSYQGDMKDPSLPWLVSVSYYMDGAQLSAERLAGASGALEIRIETSPNPDIDEAYFENYLLQITVTLDGDKSRDVSAPDASVAASGSDRAVAFTALPGKDAGYTLTADVTDFEMGGIQFAALPFALSFELPDADDMTGDMDELVDAVGELNDGTAELSDGVSELDDGAAKFADGVSEIDDGTKKFADGVSELDDGAKKFADGASELDGGAKKFADGVSEIRGGVSGLSGGSSEFNNGLKKLNEGSDGLVNGSAAIGDGLKQLSGAMAPLSAGIDLSGLFAILPPGFEQTTTGAAVVAQLDALNSGLAGISEGLGALSQNYSTFHSGLEEYTGGVGRLAENYDRLHEALSRLSGGVSDMSAGMSELSKGTSDLAKGAAELNDGASELAKGAAELSGGTAEIAEGATELNDGTAELAKGASELSDGTAELYDGVSDMPGEIEKKIDEFAEDYDKSGYEPRSFTSPKNRDVTLVQFIFRTQEIKKPDEPKPADTKEEKPSFIERVISLFKR